MSDCIFCKIAQGTIPASFVHQDDQVVAFRDLHPQAPVHVLVVPRRHIPGLTDAAASDPQVLAAVYGAVRQLAGSLGLGNGFRVVANSGQDGGQTVPHLHFHLLGGRPLAWPPG
ncbi:MAG: histidine triad nucleotide-binding protein [Candidatus Riflebacteria bacterium]|nr:histidine triad nucleotide-binding protein [Candidatus Riflebacteria bacterium]